MGDGLIDLSAAGQSDAEVVVGLGIVGLDFQRLLIMGDGLVDLSAAGQRQAEVIVGHPAVGIRVDRRPIERFDVGVHPALPPGQAGQGRQQRQANT